MMKDDSFQRGRVPLLLTEITRVSESLNESFPSRPFACASWAPISAFGSRASESRLIPLWRGASASRWSQVIPLLTASHSPVRPWPPLPRHADPGGGRQRCLPEQRVGVAAPGRGPVWPDPRVHKPSRTFSLTTGRSTPGHEEAPVFIPSTPSALSASTSPSVKW